MSKYLFVFIQKKDREVKGVDLVVKMITYTRMIKDSPRVRNIRVDEAKILSVICRMPFPPKCSPKQKL